MTREQTPFVYPAQCRACKMGYNSAVEYSEYSPTHGDYVPSGDYTIPSYCPACREQPGNSILLRRRVDLSDAVLTATGWVKRLLGLLDHPKDPTPPQSEQVEILLDILGEFEDPIEGWFDEEIFHERDARTFYYAYLRLDDEHFDELCTRARKEYNVRVRDLVEQGEKYMRENDLMEGLEDEDQ